MAAIQQTTPSYRERKRLVFYANFTDVLFSKGTFYNKSSFVCVMIQCWAYCLQESHYFQLKMSSANNRALNRGFGGRGPVFVTQIKELRHRLLGVVAFPETSFKWIARLKMFCFQNTGFSYKPISNHQTHSQTCNEITTVRTTASLAPCIPMVEYGVAFSCKST